MNEFLKALEVENNITHTENGAYTYRSTLSNCLDLFYAVGTLRETDASKVHFLVEKAYQEDPTYTLRIIFYARDIRKGLGERKVFREMVNYLAQAHPDSLAKNLKLIPEYGRWDDLITLCNVPSMYNLVIGIVKSQLDEDIANMHRNESVSLLAKWMPSINASSRETVKLAKVVSKGLHMSYQTYRHTLSSLRKYIDILESRLRAKDYTFDYAKQPSMAMLKYRRAFIRNDVSRYNQYLRDVSNGKATMHTGTLYPYDIIHRCLTGGEYAYSPRYTGNLSEDEVQALDVTWNALPDVTNGKNAITVIDGSGSMYWSGGKVQPYLVAFSLGLYFAEHSHGAFANHFITFSSNPQLVKVMGNNIVEKAKFLLQYNECSNTNVQGVFDLILNTAINNHLPQSELPDTIYIISDMEFDDCTYNGDTCCTNFQVAKHRFEDAGYTLPNVVFWNVASGFRQVPVTAHESGAMLVSGFSANLFNTVLSGDVDPTKLLLSVVNGERYAPIEA